MKLGNRDSSSRLYFKNDAITRFSYRWLRWKIKRKFNLKSSTSTLVDLDFLSKEYSKGETKILIEWDNWEGLCVVALTLESEELVIQIAKEFGLR